MLIVVRRVVIATLFALPLLPVATFAEEPPAQTTPVEPPIITSATRFETRTDTAPVNVTLITAQDLAQSHAHTLAQALQQLGHVQVNRLFGVSSRDAKLDLAGFGAAGAQNTLVLVNGQRYNEIDLTGANLAALPLASIARIEIMPGASSVLYGDNAAGGIVNIVTKSGFDAPGAALQLYSGSFGARDLSATGRWAGASDALFVAASDARSDGYRDHNTTQDSNLFSEYRHQGDSAAFGARIAANRDTAGLPGALAEATYRADPTAAGDFPNDARAHQHRGELFFSSSNLAAELAMRRKQADFDAGSGRVATTLRALSFTPRWRNVSAGSQLSVGLDAYRSTQAAQTETSRNDLTHRSVAAYVSDTQNTFEKVAFNYGARYQKLALDIATRSASGTRKDNTRDHALAWDAAVILKYAPGAKGYVRVARSFRFANIDEYCHTCDTLVALNAQKGRHVEAGLDAPLNEAARIELQIFNIALQNEIAFNRSVGIFGANVNLDDTRHSGLNFGLRVRVTPLWLTRLNYSYREAQFTTGVYVDKSLPAIPQKKFALANTFDFGAFGTLALDVYRSGERYFGNDFANAGKKMSGDTAVKVGYRYTLGSYGVRVAVDNLFNQQSADTGDYVPTNPDPYSYYPLPKRMLHVTFDATF